MLWKNTNQTWKSCLIVFELYFPVSFDLEFPESHSGNFEIKFHHDKSRGLNEMASETLVLSLN